MKILVVVSCLALGSVALAGGHGGTFSNPREVTAPSPQGHGGVIYKSRGAISPAGGHGDTFSKPREVAVSGGGHGDVFVPVAN